MAKFSRFVLGGIVGAALGMLMAPKAGKELRQMLFGGGQPAPPSGAIAGYPEQEPPVDLEAKIEETRQQVEAEMEEAIAAAPVAVEAPVEEAAEEEPAAEEPVVVEPAAEEPEEEAEAAAVVPEEVAEPTESGAETAESVPSQMDRDEMRRRIEETRARLKAKAFDTMVEGETFLATEEDSGKPSEPPQEPEIDSETGEKIDELLEEED